MECVPALFRRGVPSYEDVRRRVLKVFVEPVVVPRGVRRYGRERVKVFRYVVKCERVYQVVAESLSRVSTLPKLGDLPPFYAELIDIASDGAWDQIVDRARKGVKIVSRLWKEYRSKILSCYSGAEAKKLAREFVGRVLSVVRRSLKNFDKIENVVKIMRITPCIDTEAPTIIVAGMPQVGKSTLVSTLSSAKPEIAPYPFTTKNVILGHMDLGPIKLQIIDTPGILDRPVEEMNPIERRAVAALKHLKAVVLFLMDPSKDSYYGFDEQVATLRNVLQICGRDRTLIVFNKVDKVDRSRLEECRKIVEGMGMSVDAEISALYGIGIDNMLRKVAEKLRELYGIDIERLLRST